MSIQIIPKCLIGRKDSDVIIMKRSFSELRRSVLLIRCTDLISIVVGDAMLMQ